MTPLAIAQDLGRHWYIYVSMPLAAAVIGYVTKIVAIEMMFRPIEFRGIRPFLGWQGIIPRRAAKMAGIACDTLTQSLLKPEELLDRLDPARLVEEIEQPLLDAVGDITRAIASEYQPGLWEAMPEVARRALIRRIHSRAPAVVASMLVSVRANLDQVFDMKHMVVSNLVRDKRVLNRLFRDVCAPEMRFLARSGMLFGFTIGLLQMVTYALTESHLVLPAFGLFTGSFTDWVALQMIFRPMTRRGVGPFGWQGMFHKRRAEVTRDYGTLIAQDILTPRAIMDSVLNGPMSDKLFDLVLREVQTTVDCEMGMAKPFVVLAVGGRRYQEMKRAVAAQVIERMPDTLGHVEGYAAEALDIKGTVIERMGLMTIDQYENLLRPVVKDDEWVIVAVGAALGFIVGELQVLLVTSVH